MFHICRCDFESLQIKIFECKILSQSTSPLWLIQIKSSTFYYFQRNFSCPIFLGKANLKSVIFHLYFAFTCLSFNCSELLYGSTDGYVEN